MNGAVVVGFLLKPISISLTNLLPTRATPSNLSQSAKYLQILSSVREIGLVEPLSVAPGSDTEMYPILDGHIRLLVLKELKQDSALCLVAKEDEAYTYNSKINRLSTVQEHMMIRRAIERGVSPERLALALNVNINQIQKKATLLKGICPEAVELLQDRRFSLDVARYLRQMIPARQIECVKLMIGANTVTAAYAQAMLIATPAGMKSPPHNHYKPSLINPENAVKMEQEMSCLRGQYSLVEKDYGQEILNLVIVKAYLNTLLRNKKIFGYIRQQHGDLLSGLETIVDNQAMQDA